MWNIVVLPFLTPVADTLQIICNVWLYECMYPLHKLVFQCRSNHNFPKPSVDRFSFQPLFCIGLSCAQFLGWSQK